MISTSKLQSKEAGNKFDTLIWASNLFTKESLETSIKLFLKPEECLKSENPKGTQYLLIYIAKWDCVSPYFKQQPTCSVQAVLKLRKFCCCCYERCWSRSTESTASIPCSQVPLLAASQEAVAEGKKASSTYGQFLP